MLGKQATPRAADWDRGGRQEEGRWEQSPSEHVMVCTGFPPPPRSGDTKGDWNIMFASFTAFCSRFFFLPVPSTPRPRTVSLLRGPLTAPVQPRGCSELSRCSQAPGPPQPGRSPARAHVHACTRVRSVRVGPGERLWWQRQGLWFGGHEPRSGET